MSDGREKTVRAGFRARIYIKMLSFRLWLGILRLRLEILKKQIRIAYKSVHIWTLTHISIPFSVHVCLRIWTWYNLRSCKKCRYVPLLLRSDTLICHCDNCKRSPLLHDGFVKVEKKLRLEKVEQ